MEIDEIVNKKNIRDGILFIPKEVEQLNIDMGEKIKELAIKKVAFESESQLKEVMIKACADNDVLEVVDFSNCSELDVINHYAFFNCKKLRRIEFGENKKIRGIGISAFKNTGLEEFDLSNCETLFQIGGYAFQDCKNLKQLKFCNCLGLRRIFKGIVDGDDLDLLDFTGCDNIDTINDNVLNSLVTRFSNQLNGKISSLFRVMCPRNCKFQIMNGNDVQLEIEYGDKEFANVDVVSLKRYFYIKKLGLPIPELSNLIYTQKGLDIASKNRKQMKEIVFALEEKGCKIQRIFIALNKLGYFGTFTKEKYEDSANKDIFAFSNSKREPMATKGDVQSYKHELARIIVENKIKNNIKCSYNEQIITQMLETAINKYARHKTLTELVGEFIQIKILPHSYCNKLINELRFGKINYHLDINFAKFFVRNFDEIMNKKVSKLTDDLRTYGDFVESPDGKIRLYQIYNNFIKIIEKYPNKKILINESNKDNGLTLEDCEFNTIYDNVDEDEQELANLCGRAHIEQDGFNKIKELNNISQKVVDYQILKICDDSAECKPITYEFIYKDNPIGFVLGNITNCCQRFGSAGFSCMANGMTDPNAGFIVFKLNNKIIGQSWVWYNERQKVIAFDNIEVPNSIQKEINEKYLQSFNDCLARASKNFIKTMKDNGKEVKNIIVGNSCTDVKLENFYELEAKSQNEIICEQKFEDKYCYTDINEVGQYYIIKNGKLQTKINQTLNKNEFN